MTDLTVVVPSVNGWADLSRCLGALEGELVGRKLEVLVPERCGSAVRQAIESAFPWVVVLPVPPRTTIPEMRAVGFDRATGASVAVIEDHVIVPSGWAHDLLLARESARVIGGAVRNMATERLIDWAAFLCEYSQLMPPLTGGPSESLAGNNVVYDKALLNEHRAAYHAGQWEGHLHRTFQQAGVALLCRPDIVVGHQKHYTVGEYLAQRYLYARSFAGARVAARNAGVRALFGAGALALPPLLFARTISRSFGKSVRPALIWRAMPLIALFACAWAAGEFTGYWFGAGDSLRQVR